MDARFLLGVGLLALLTVTPGADMAFITSTTLSAGRRAALCATLGVVSGLLVHAVASAAGLSILLARSAEAYTIVKLAGAAYLVYLGARALIAAGRSTTPLAATAAIAETAKPTTRVPPGPSSGRAVVWYRRGLLTNVLNPKVALFYLTFLPQFVAPGDSVLLTFLALAAIHAAMGVAWLVALAWSVERLGQAFTGPRVKRALEAATGAVLVAFGLRLATESAAR
ncbi:MAG: LysE family translocator [Thermoplasmatota archaeon]